MPPKHRSSRKKLPVYSIIPFFGLLVFGLLNYSLAPPGELHTFQDSNILLSIIRASFYLVAGLFFITNLKKNTSWLVRRFELMACVVFVLASVTWTSHADRLMIGALHLIGSIIAAYVAALYFSQKENKHNTYHYLSIFFGIFAIASFIASVGLPAFGTQYFEWENVTRWRGVTTNANMLGMACLFGIWSSLAAFFLTDIKKRKIIYSIFIVLAAINLWGSDSKTSLITIVVSVLVFVFINSVAGGSNVSRQKKGLFAAYAFVLLGIVISLLFADKFVATDMIESMGRGSDLSGRDTLWADAIIMIKESPIVGWSFDGRATAYDFIPQLVNHYHNGYLDLAVRGGFIGLFVFLYFIFKHLRIVTKLSTIDTHYFSPILAITLGFLVYNITEVTLASFDSIFWIVILFTYFIAEREIRNLRIKNRRKKKRKKFVHAPKVHKKKPVLSDSF